MSLKAPHLFKTLGQEEVPDINQALIRAYQTRVESINKNNAGADQKLTYQSMEHGEVSMSPNGSPTISQVFGLIEKQNTIVYVNAHSTSEDVHAAVTANGNTSITITLRTISGTANFSDVTDGPVTVFYQVVGSSP